MADAKYTPTTDEVRKGYGVGYYSHGPARLEVTDLEFDRWLAAHDAEVRAKILRDVDQEVKADQLRVAGQHADMRVWIGEAARTWSFGMSNAGRIIRDRARIEEANASE